jgi:hypothetical protein
MVQFTGEDASGGRGESFPPDPLKGTHGSLETAGAYMIFPLEEGLGGDHPLPAAGGIFT